MYTVPKGMVLSFYPVGSGRKWFIEVKEYQKIKGKGLLHRSTNQLPGTSYKTKEECERECSRLNREQSDYTFFKPKERTYTIFEVYVVKTVSPIVTDVNAVQSWKAFGPMEL